jgi:hypothetical protein
MVLRQIFSFFKKNKLLLLLLTVFFIKQIVFVAILPIFQGPDEPLHYSRIQHLAESEKNIPEKNEIENKKIKDARDISTFNFSEELINTAEFVETDQITFHSSKTGTFSNTSDGPHEKTIKNSEWKRYVENSDISLKKETITYYFSSSLIEKSLSQKNIFIRFYAIRIFSAILGLLSVFFIFLAARKIFDEKISFILSALVVFQPMFSQTAGIINYDILLVLVFSAFTYGFVFALKDGINWKNSLILLLSTVLGIATKAPGIVLVLMLFSLAVYFAKKHFQLRTGIFIAGIIVTALLAVVALLMILPNSYISSLFLISQKCRFDSVFQSIMEYVLESKSRWSWSELSFWGNFGWLDTRISSWIVSMANYIELLSVAGVAAYFVFPKKVPDFLPKRKFVIFFIGIFLALEFVIRFADWTYFNRSGVVQLGTPGRYFLPVIGAQFSLIVIGLGMLVRKYFIWKNILKVLALGMILLWVYSVLIVIIPRYYL